MVVKALSNSGMMRPTLMVQCVFPLLTKDSGIVSKLTPARHLATIFSSKQIAVPQYVPINNSFYLHWLHNVTSQQQNDYSTATMLSLPARAAAAIQCKETAGQFVRWLEPVERDFLKKAIQDIDQEINLEDNTTAHTDPKPSKAQLRLLIIANAIPFIGFGFLDNAIMITAGDFIDAKLGVTLGISTMAAAGFGNLISDMAGIGLASYVEGFAIRVGFAEPPLSNKQRAMNITKNSGYFGRGLGIAIGCVLGMCPLLIIH